MESQPKALTKIARLPGLDLARGIALLGIIVNHVFFTAAKPITQALQDYHAVLFMLLAGIVFTYAQTPDYKLKNIVRGIVCIVLGLVIGAGNPNIDVILINYGVLFLLGTFIIPKRTLKQLWILSITWIVLSPIISFFIRNATGTRIGSNIGFPTLFSQPWLIITNPILFSHYPILQWFSIFLIGSALGKTITSVLSRKWTVLVTSLLFYLLCKVISVVAMIWSQHVSIPRAIGMNFELGLGNVDTHRVSNLWVSSAYSGTTLSLICSTCVSMVVITLCSMCRFSEKTGLLRLMGMSTLSLYTLHAIVQTCVPNTWINAHSVLYYILTICLLALFTWAWNKLVKNRIGIKSTGPLEAITQTIVETEKRKSTIQVSS